MANKQNRKKGNFRRPLFLTILLVAILILDAGLFGTAAIRYIYYRSNYLEDDAVSLMIADAETREDKDSWNVPDDDEDEEGKVWQEAESEEEFIPLDKDEEKDILAVFEVAFQELATMEDEALAEEGGEGEAVDTPASSTYNLLLLGADRAHSSAGYFGNSDVIVLLTFNESKQTIYMTSFMRDLFANIPGHGVFKLNAAFAKGGGPLAVQTLTSNYGVRIDNYATVDYSSTAAIIDMFGGVDVDVSPAEAAYAALPSNGAGVLTHLNGVQAVEYARIRHIGNADYERTARQREVLTSLYSRMRGMGIMNWMGIADSILPMITHNISPETMAYLVSKAPTWLNYNLVQLRVPFDGHYYSSNEILVPDAGYTLSTLLGTLYY